jgi:hypothetical protein
MCRLHRDMFGINGHPVPSSAKARFMEMLNKKDLIWELMFYYNPQFLHICHNHNLMCLLTMTVLHGNFQTL